MSTESTATPTPVKKKDKILGMDTEDIALGLGALGVLGVAVLSFLKLQDMNVLPKPPQQIPQSRVTIGAPTDVQPQAVAAAATGGVVERDPLGPESNSVAMDLGSDYVDQERLAKSRSSIDRINAGY